MATMATEQGAGGLTPPSTAAPSTHASRQVSREASASMTNNPYDGNTTTNNASGRDARANSLAEPLPPHNNNTTGQRRDVLGGGVAAAAQAAAVSQQQQLAQRGAVSSSSGVTNMSTSSTTTTNNNTNNTINQQSQQQPPPDNNNNTSPTSQQQQGASETISYSAERIIGNGSFGVVFQASVVETGETVAIKKVLQDKRFKNRELQIMRQLVKDGHSNIVSLKHCFYSQVSSSFVYKCIYIWRRRRGGGCVRHVSCLLWTSLWGFLFCHFQTFDITYLIRSFISFLFPPSFNSTCIYLYTYHFISTSRVKSKMNST